MIGMYVHCIYDYMIRITYMCIKTNSATVYMSIWYVCMYTVYMSIWYVCTYMYINIHMIYLIHVCGAATHGPHPTSSATVYMRMLCVCTYMIPHIYTYDIFHSCVLHSGSQSHQTSGATVHMSTSYLCTDIYAYILVIYLIYVHDVATHGPRPSLGEDSTCLPKRAAARRQYACSGTATHFAPFMSSFVGG